MTYDTGRGRRNATRPFVSRSRHHVSKGHLHRYCDEFEFRYNNRIALGVADGERANKIVLGAGAWHRGQRKPERPQQKKRTRLKADPTDNQPRLPFD